MVFINLSVGIVITRLLNMYCATKQMNLIMLLLYNKSMHLKNNKPVELYLEVSVQSHTNSDHC